MQVIEHRWPRRKNPIDIIPQENANFRPHHPSHSHTKCRDPHPQAHGVGIPILPSHYPPIDYS